MSMNGDDAGISQTALEWTRTRARPSRRVPPAPGWAPIRAAHRPRRRASARAPPPPAADPAR